MPKTPDPPAWLFALNVTVIVSVIAAWSSALARKWRGKPILMRRRRERVPWGAEAGLLPMLFLANAAASLLVEAPEAAEESAISLAGVATHGTLLGFFIVVAVAVLGARHPLRRGHFGLGHSLFRMLGDVPLGVFATALMLPAVYALQLLLVWGLGPPIPHPSIEVLRDSPSFDKIAAVTLAAVVLAPLVEEFAFRVLLQGWLERYGSRRAWWPIGVSALLFAVAHTNQGYAPLPLFLLAMGFGYVYRQTHSYPAVVVMHMVFNALTLAVTFGMPPEVAQVP